MHVKLITFCVFLVLPARCRFLRLWLMRCLPFALQQSPRGDCGLFQLHVTAAGGRSHETERGEQNRSSHQGLVAHVPGECHQGSGFRPGTLALVQIHVRWRVLCFRQFYSKYLNRTTAPSWSHCLEELCKCMHRIA